MIFTFSVDTSDSPDLGKTIIDTVRKVALNETLDPTSPDWAELTEKTNTLMGEWSDKLMAATASWAEWMIGR